MHHVRSSQGGSSHQDLSVSLPQSVTISGLDVAVGLDQRLPLLHHRPQLVGGQPHPVEVGQAVLALLDKPI